MFTLSIVHRKAKVGRREVFEALRSGLPVGWYAWDSLRLRSGGTGEFTEGDLMDYRRRAVRQARQETVAQDDPSPLG